MAKLSTNNHLSNLQCSEHNNFYDKFCINCNIQFFSKCKLAENHTLHNIKNIKKNNQRKNRKCKKK